MRIILLGFVTIIGANIFITVMNSKTVDVIQERNAAIEALMNPPSDTIK
jgi:hypothetical protein|tara:strand:- start:39 stop:185 length:147 start_codon:yes stop_codon:yes gene_type:complete